MTVSFERFRDCFRLIPEDQTASTSWNPSRSAAPTGFAELMGIAGCSFHNGMYRLHSAETGRIGQAAAELAFPSHAPALVVFGYDWLGRQFALDYARVDRGEPLIMMLEPGTGEVLGIPSSFVSFHDEELVDHANEALAREFFADWQSVHPDAVPLAMSECVGYRLPLFLGGSDTIENLEVTDFDVYWTTTTQLHNQVRTLPDDTQIRGIAIDD